MNFGPISGTLTAATVTDVELDGTPIRIEVAHLGSDGDEPIFFVLADTEDADGLEDPAVEGDGCEAVGVGQRITLPVRRTPQSTLKQVVVKLISAGAVDFSVAVR